jgi:SAM-dependent methyltransferase
MPSVYIQQAVLSEVQRYSQHPDLRIVDVSASDGRLLRRLYDAGYRNLTGTLYGAENEWEYQPAPGEFDFATFVPKVDVLAGMPFEDGAFDVVINTELLEHLENHPRALTELSRIVKPGGLLVLETPNIMRLQSRFYFFLTGFHKPRTQFPPYHKPLAQHLYYHVFPIHLPVLDYFLFQLGMERVRLRWNKWKLFPVLLLLLLWPLILLFEAEFVLREKSFDRPTKWRLFKLQLHPAVLLCDVLIMTWRKAPGRP